MPEIDALITELRADGELDSVGEFTLDRSRAREKMRHFQLADPRSYVLELVQAAVLAGATEARFEIDADDMRLAFDGRPFTTEDFDELYSSMFVRRPASGARRQLALGLNAVMALDPRHVHISSGEARVEMRPGADDEITRAARPVDGTRIHVRYRFGKRTVLRFFRKLRGDLAEVAYLEELCSYVRLPIYVNGEAISGQAPLADALARVEATVSGFSFVAGFVAERRAARLAILEEGVWIVSHRLAELPPPFVCCVDSAGFERDASQRDIVRDEAYDRLLSALPEVLHLALARLAELVPEHPGREALFRQVLFHPSTLPLAREQLAAVRAGNAPPREKLAAAPLWESARSPRIFLSLLDLFRLETSRKDVGSAPSRYPRIVQSLLDLFRSGTPQQRVGWAHSRYPIVIRQDEPPIPVILWERERSYLAELFGDSFYNADPLLHDEETRIRKSEGWRRRRSAKSPESRVKRFFPTFESPEIPHQTREDRLLRALQTELRRAGKQYDHLLDDKNLDRMALANLQSDVITSCGSQGVTVDRQQPLVRRLLERNVIDPVPVAFLASSVYTALNHFWPEIEDDHERDFHRELVAGLLDAGSGDA